MSKQEQIMELIDNADKMLAYHDDLYFTDTLSDKERAFHATKYHFYRGQKLALSQALSIIEDNA